MPKRCLNCSDGSFQTYNFNEWHDFSRQEPHPESVSTISFRIRMPRVILLLVFDHLPKKEVKFTRHNIFERDKNTCQYCGKTFDRKDLEPRSRDSARPRRPDDVGEHCLLLHRVQHAQGQPHAAGSRHAS